MSENPATLASLQAGPWWPLVSFTIKTVIVAIAVTISLLILLGYLMSGVNEQIDKRVQELHAAMGSVSGRAFWMHAEQALDRAAEPENAISSERQQKLLEDIRILADRARPFVVEVTAAFSSQNKE